MATLILDLENDIDVEQFVSTVASMKGIKNIDLKKNSSEEINATKLSEKFRGVFSKEAGESFVEHTKNMREEWDSI